MRKKAVAAAVAAALITTSAVSVCSAVQTESISVVRNQAQIITGDAKFLTADNFNYNGSLYVPLRAVSEEMGLSVTWNDDIKTAEIRAPQADKSLIDKLLYHENMLYAYYSLELSWKQTERLFLYWANLNQSAIQDNGNVLQKGKDYFVSTCSRFDTGLYDKFTYIDISQAYEYSDALQMYDKLIEVNNILQALKSAKASPPDETVDMFYGLGASITEACVYFHSVFQRYAQSEGE
jgi:hypothetical protein